jgi:ubiquinone/menaquinone biosynthesis C-methylase UbiE
MNARVSGIPAYIWQLLSGQRLRHEQMIADLRKRDLGANIAPSGPMRVLDLANGRLRPQHAILRADRHEVYGVDLINRPSHSPTDLAYGAARKLYSWQLGLPRAQAGDRTLVCGDVGVLPFPSDFFDMATSVAALEHFLDIPTVVSELHRVLRPGGLTWVCIHMFSSPSGGHNVNFVDMPMRSMPVGVEPWDHLRKRRLPFFVPLNEWRKDQYLKAFARHFTILKHYCAIREGEHLLTPALEAELADYSRDELTCAAYVIMARKDASQE